MEGTPSLPTYLPCFLPTSFRPSLWSCHRLTFTPGYYDGIIFHRIVKGFIIQTGDPTGTGMGGESVYGEPFADEVHSRLKFNRLVGPRWGYVLTLRRGLIGMANNSKRNTNNSQWFITLDRADELTGKHTMFGRINGPTYYSMFYLLGA